MAINLDGRSANPKPLRRLLARTRASWQAIRNNPIIIKELRHRMRSWHGLVDLAGCTLLLAAFGLISYNSISSNSYRFYVSYSNSYGGSYVARSQELGTNYFTVIIIAQLFLACFLAPSYSSGTIAEEKERQTYDVLLVTLLRPRDIIIGKLFAALAYLLLVIIAGVPVASVAFLMGGVGLDQLGAALLVMLFTGVMLGSIGIFWSAVARTTRQANRNTFLNLLALLFALPVGIFFGVGFILQPNYSFSLPLYAESPLRDIMAWFMSINPMYAVLSLGEILKNRSGSNILFYSNTPGSWTITPLVRFLVLSTIISVIYIWQATRKIRPLRQEGERHPARNRKLQKAKINPDIREQP